MTYKKEKKLLFLAWGSPWPAHSGGALRTLGLLKEISKYFEVELLILTPCPLSNEQMNVLNKYSKTIIQVPLLNISLQEKLRVLWTMFKLKIPYHCAVLEASFQKNPDTLQKIQNYHGIVYASYGHWGTLLRRKNVNWVLDQHNADVDFWRVYASQVRNLRDLPIKLAALINWKLCDAHFRRIYSNVGRIISVCEEDKLLTRALVHSSELSKIDVIENGIDCSYYYPDKVARNDGMCRLLFTGTSVIRNMTALHKFMRDIFPLIEQKMQNVELLVGGNFHAKARSQFRAYRGIRFTGQVDDMRPIFNQSDIYVLPFEDTHGSKLKTAEAMAMGMAIVSTPEGIRGFPLVDGESVLIAHNNIQFAEHVVSLFTDKVKRENMGAEARKVAETFLDWEVLGKRLMKIIDPVHRELCGV